MIKIYRVPQIDVEKSANLTWGTNYTYNQGYWYLSSLDEAKKVAQNEINYIPIGCKWMGNDNPVPDNLITPIDVYETHEEAMEASKKIVLKDVLDKLTEEEILLLKDEFVDEYKKDLNDFTPRYCSYCDNTGIIGDHLGAVTCQCKL